MALPAERWSRWYRRGCSPDVGPASLPQLALPADLPAASRLVASWVLARRAVWQVLPAHRSTVPRVRTTQMTRMTNQTLRSRRLPTLPRSSSSLPSWLPSWLSSSLPSWLSSSLPSWLSSSLPHRPWRQASHRSDAGQPAARWWMRRSGRIRPSLAISQGLLCSRPRALERAHRPEPWTRFSCLGPGVTRTTRSNAASSCSRAHWVFISEPLLRGRRQRCCQRRNLHPRPEDLGTHLRDVDTRAGKGP